MIDWTTAYLFFLTACTAVYAVVLFGFMRGLKRLKSNRIEPPRDWPSVCVVLPARNEAEVLALTLDSLLKQDYPGEWGIVVVDDRSEDETPRILSEYASLNSRVRFIRVSDPKPVSPKKNALALGIRNTDASIVFTTDADCVYEPEWIRNMVMHMGEDVGVVAGLTVFHLPVPSPPLWQPVQWLDFFVQNFLAAAAVGAGVPGSCNGSNLAYRRKVYDEIEGFGDSARQVSGDDVLFAQRVATRTNWKTVFATTRATRVRSLPVLTFREMVHQRLRWASKGLAYRGSMLSFLFGVYAYYALISFAPVVVFLRPDTAFWIAAAVSGKFVIDFAVVRQGCRIFEQNHLLRYYPIYWIAHLYFTPFAGLGGLLLPYRWKGDWYRTSRMPTGVRRRMVRIRRRMRPKRPMIQARADLK